LLKSSSFFIKNHFCDLFWTSNHPQEDVAKFGSRTCRIVLKICNHVVVWRLLGASRCFKCGKPNPKTFLFADFFTKFSENNPHRDHKPKNKFHIFVKFHTRKMLAKLIFFWNFQYQNFCQILRKFARFLYMVQVCS
jgi:hypothetical protein